MKVLSFSNEAETEKTEVTLLLGNFDGLHIGHKTLIDCAKSFKRPMAIVTFKNLCRDGYVKSVEERILEYERMGFDYTILLDYDEIKTLTGDEFLTKLLGKFNIKHMVCGEDFKICGKTADEIEQFVYGQNIWCTVLSLTSLTNQRLSSSNIKRMLKNGNIEQANRLLLEDYSIYSTVIHGNRIGRTINYPTINIALNPFKVELKNGVYLVYTYINDIKYYGIANYGTKPTVNENSKNLEIYLLDFNQNVYGEKLEVYFVKYLRSTKKFDSLEELRRQIDIDVDNARDIINERE